MPLSPEELQQITESISASILQSVHSANSGLAANLTKSLRREMEEKISALAPQNEPNNEPSPQQGNNTPSPELRAVQQELAQIREQQKQEAARLASTQKQNAIESMFSGKNAVKTGVLTKAFLTEYGDNLSESNGKYFYEDSEGQVVPAEKLVTDYLGSDFGSNFIKGADGSQVDVSKGKAQTTPQKKLPSLNASLLSPEE